VLPLEVRERTIQDGLEKTRTQGFVSRLAGLFRKELDESIEEQLEEILLTSDIGVRTAQKLLDRLRSQLDRSELRSRAKVWDFLRQDVRTILTGTGSQDQTSDAPGPRVIAIVGVNGTGKTTTMGKLAHRYVAQGKRVHLVAADTFRAAAVDQLQIWAERAQATLYRGAEAQDPASVAFDGVRKGIEDKADVIMVDTAGRLHTKKHLLDELKKILKVIGKAMPSAPHETLLVLDATTGQNAIQQAEIFHGEVGISGIVLTKLDGTAKGGVIIGICDMMQIPVRYVGVGETLQDLKPFDPDAFVQGMFGS
jgi:fused signal recognition particle receptor